MKVPFLLFTRVACVRSGCRSDKRLLNKFHAIASFWSKACRFPPSLGTRGPLCRHGCPVTTSKQCSHRELVGIARSPSSSMVLPVGHQQRHGQFPNQHASTLSKLFPCSASYCCYAGSRRRSLSARLLRASGVFASVTLLKNSPIFSIELGAAPLSIARKFSMHFQNAKVGSVIGPLMRAKYRDH